MKTFNRNILSSVGIMATTKIFNKNVIIVSEDNGDYKIFESKKLKVDVIAVYNTNHLYACIIYIIVGNTIHVYVLNVESEGLACISYFIFNREKINWYTCQSVLNSMMTAIKTVAHGTREL